MPNDLGQRSLISLFFVFAVEQTTYSVPPPEESTDSRQSARKMTLTERKRTFNREVGIVGGSTAGLFAAHLLSRAGKHVCIFESSPKFDAKPRTLIVTSRIRDVLGRIGDRAVVNEIRRFELFT